MNEIINDDLLLFTTIADPNGDKDSWYIEALLRPNGYCMPSLMNNKLDFEADNSTWILTNLKPTLKTLIKKGKVTKKLRPFVDENLKNVPKEDYKLILKLIKQAERLNFFKDL